MLSYWLNMQRAWLEQGQRLVAQMPMPLPVMPLPVMPLPPRAAAETRPALPTAAAASEIPASEPAPDSIRSGLSSAELPLLPESEAEAVAAQQVIHLLAEDLEVDRRQVEAGRVQIRRVTRTEAREVDEELARLDAEIEHVAIGIEVESVPAVRETDDRIIIPVVEEIIVVERRLMLREEIHVHKRHSSARHQEQVLLRIQDALITRLPPQAAAAGSNG